MKPEPQRDQGNEPRHLPGDMLTLVPDFDEPDQADAEFTAWRWPERCDD